MKLENLHRVSLVIPQPDKESTAIVRRLSTPFHGLPSVLDFDRDTGFITFGEMITPPPKVIHPRPFKEPMMPVVDPFPGSCWHEYCLTNRRRLYGLPVDEKPIGLPWASGLLKHLPGQIKYDYPIPKSYKPLPKLRRKKLSVTDEQQDRRKLRNKILGEMLYFYKIVMLAGSIVSEARAEMRPSQEEQVVDESGSGGPSKINTAQPSVGSASQGPITPGGSEGVQKVESAIEEGEKADTDDIGATEEPQEKLESVEPPSDEEGLKETMPEEVEVQGSGDQTVMTAETTEKVEDESS